MKEALKQIEAVIEDYFYGSHEADVEKLNRAFHPDAKIAGNFDGHYVEMTREQFIERVTAAKKEAGDKVRKFDKNMVAIDWHHDVAQVKARVLVGDAYFIDYISLIKIDGAWVIRHKSFTNAI